MGVVIGMDPHKSSATIEVVDERAAVLMKGRFGTDRTGYTQLLAAGRKFDDRVWALAATSRLIVGARPSSAAIKRSDQPAANPREISSRSANDNRPSRRRRGDGRIPPHRNKYVRTVPVDKSIARATGFAACPAWSRSQIASICRESNRA